MNLVTCDICNGTSPADAQYCINCGVKFDAYTKETQRLPITPSGAAIQPDYGMYIESGTNTYRTIIPFLPKTASEDYKSYIESLMRDAIDVNSAKMDLLERNPLFMSIHIKGFNRMGLYMGTLYIEE